MYYPTGSHVHYLDAHRILELHRMQCLMDKHRQAYDHYEPLRRLAMVEHGSRSNPPHKPLTSFKIDDILDGGDRGNSNRNSCDTKSNHETEITSDVGTETGDVLDDSDFSEGSSSESSVWSKRGSQNRDENEQNCSKIIRPWSASPSSSASDAKCGNSTDTKSDYHDGSNASKRLRLSSVAESDDEEEIDVEGCDDDVEEEVTQKSKCKHNPLNVDLSPLDALVAMSSKTFMGLDSFESQRQREQDKHKSQSPRKKRKTRTAFTNQQIYELERRFIMQKYLTPADRDEIAGRLGLTCAQVITWFQNRRAKFKRDIEEMKNDVVAASPEPCDKNKHSNE